MGTVHAGFAVVVDDEPANRDFLERLIRLAGFTVHGAGTAAQALEAARAAPSLTLALVDQELPDMPGVDLIRALRAENPQALLVMATMHDARELIDRAFRAGVDVYLVKPHGFMELFRRLQTAGADTTQLRQLIIDQYGLRPYRGAPPAPVSSAPPST